MICKKIADSVCRVSSKSEHLISTAKTVDYINWRFFGRPVTSDRTYHVISLPDACLLFSVYYPRDEINILEFCSSSDSGKYEALTSLRLYADLNQINSIKFFGCRNSHLARDILNLFSQESDVHFERLDMIVHSLGKPSIDFDVTTLVCSMSFLDNDVY